MITTNPPQVNEHGMYPVSKVAELLGVDRSTVRRWCNEGLLHYSIRRGQQRKLIPGRQIINLWYCKA